ncbi:minor capsid protein [Ammoniphilus resinae]|uniref:SPP1 gp7 family putative phage head morphogenesis protein n=1 Tax=Ammoniphilus resinae TaxID=861532 RepID=A0ABS4GYY7_9BACL|nr:minor capsid protein [Ammoniphilus resinae]MBP1935095.1 SPP1 gp7 family putative phage head morphogenesis protein [Ammoniphilus resinae]
MADLEKELLKKVESLFNLSDELHKEILKAYKTSLDSVREMLAKFYIKYAVDGKLNYSDLMKYNRLLYLEEQIKEEVKKLGGIELKQVKLILKDIYQQAYYQTAYTLESASQVAISFSLLKPEFVKEAVTFNWSGVPFSERIWGNHDGLVKALRTQLTRGILEGESLDKLARRIKNEFDSKAYQSQRLVRTESARVIAQGQLNIYESSGVIERVQWMSTLDSKTSQICRERDGKIFKLGEQPVCPAHPNCRSTYTPYLGKEFEIKKRKDNQTKEIIPYKNYEEWYQAKVKK